MPLESDIVLVPEFVLTADALYEHLVATIVWDESGEDYKLANFGEACQFSNTSYPGAMFPARLGKILSVLEMELGFLPNNCLIHHYPEGQTGAGFCLDDLDDLEPETGVAIMSLGYEQRLVVRHRHNESFETSIQLPNGSLLYIPPHVQREVIRCELEQEGSKGRLSLTFRRLK